MRLSSRIAALVVGLFVTVSGLKAQITFVWTGNGDSAYYYNSYYYGANWQGGMAPTEFETNTGTDLIVFGQARNTEVRYSEIRAHQIQFSNFTRPYRLEAFYGATIYLGAGGLIYNPGSAVHSVIDDAFMLTAGQTWNIAAGSVRVQGGIGETNSATQLTKTGAGTLLLEPAYHESGSWSGGFLILDGRVATRANYVIEDYYYAVPAPVSALGSGTITFDSTGGGTPTLVARPLDYYGDDDYPFVVSNAVAINGTFTAENQTEMILTGAVSLLSHATVSSRGAGLFIHGGISGAGRSLTINSSGVVVLDAAETESTNTYDGGTHVEKGVLIFGNAASIPATGTISVAAQGYAGLAATSSSPADFLAKFNPAATHGTIGFDSDPDGNTNVFEGLVDLTGFSSTARLGSATSAVLGSESTLTPQGTDYRFGGGGGTLVVAANLNGARNVAGDSLAGRPLTVRFIHTGNDFTGTISATHTALVFAAGTLPATATPQLLTGGYIGYEDLAGPQAFIDRFAPSTAQGMIGLNGSGSGGLISAHLNLSAFTGGVYLGTNHTGYTDDGLGGGLRLTGTITTGNGGTDPYRFGGYKGGLLRVESSLTGSAGVHIGDPNTPATFGDYLQEEYSTVALMGDNSGLSGNVTLYGGMLYVGHTNALGSGTLVVQGMTLPPEWRDLDESPLAPVLMTDYGATIANNLTLNSRLDIAEYTDTELTGKISGSGQLYLLDGAELTLGNNANDFTGGVYVSADSHLYLDADHAAGTGPLTFGYGSGSYVYFGTANPVIGGLASGSEDYSYLYSEQDNTRLTVDQDFDSTFRGEVSTYDSSGLRFVKSGSGTLRWQSGSLNASGGLSESGLPSSPAVSIEVQGGRLILGNSFNIDHGPTIWVRNGGTLAVDNQSSLHNPIALDPGARLAGHGSFASVSIGTGAVLSPGLAGAGEIGTLGFAHLELNSGGILEWQIQNPTGVSGEGFDRIHVYTDDTLVINATAEAPFSLRIISLASGGSTGLLAGLTPGESYSWMLISSDSTTGTFDPAKFALDVAQFQTSLGVGLDAGEFSVSLSGNNLMLNFTAVPEPSTYALMVLGLGFVIWSLRRRRA